MPTGQNAAGDAALFRRADTTDYAEVAWDEGQKSIKVRRYNTKDEIRFTAKNLLCFLFYDRKEGG